MKLLIVISILILCSCDGCIMNPDPFAVYTNTQSIMLPVQCGQNKLYDSIIIWHAGMKL